MPVILLAVSLLVERNATDMTVRQKVLKTLYPAFIRAARLLHSKQEQQVSTGTPAPVSFYTLQARDLSGNAVDFHQFRGKKILIVNTASDCGYTAQYEALEELHRKYGQRLTVIAFPANDFKEQEKGSAAEIAAFCRKNYGVTFLLMEKSVVLPGKAQHPVYQWLTRSALNGWNNRPPSWNFFKYLVDEQGNLQAFLGPSVSPLDPALTSLLP